MTGTQKGEKTELCRYCVHFTDNVAQSLVTEYWRWRKRVWGRAERRGGGSEKAGGRGEKEERGMRREEKRNDSVSLLLGQYGESW